MLIRKGYVDTKVGQVHFRTAGTTGPAVILLHQTASSSQMYLPFMGRLADEFRLFALDTPGFGGSDPHPSAPSISDFVSTLHEATTSLGIEKFHLIGHHTGAVIATQWAADHPESVLSLTMLGALAMGESERANWNSLIEPAPVLADGSHFDAAWQRVAGIDKAPVKFPPSPALRHREAVDVLVAAPRWPEAYLAVFQHDFESALTAVDCPKLLISGNEDILYPYFEATRAIVPDSEVFTLDAGVYLLEQNLDEVAPVVADFLASVHPDAPASPTRGKDTV